MACGGQICQRCNARRDYEISGYWFGRMGAAIAHRVRNAGYCVLGYDPDLHAQKEVAQFGVEIYQTVDELAKEADVVWLMVPAGKIVDQAIAHLTTTLKRGSIIIDGGNCLFTDSIRRAKELSVRGFSYLDCGTSGGIHGQKNGFCLMVGGEFAAYQKVEPLLKVIAAPHGYGYMGPSGAGHYVKMIHNGIEYGLLEAYAEGFHSCVMAHIKNWIWKKLQMCGCMAA